MTLRGLVAVTTDPVAYHPRFNYEPFYYGSHPTDTFNSLSIFFHTFVNLSILNKSLGKMSRINTHRPTVRLNRQMASVCRGLAMMVIN